MYGMEKNKGEKFQFDLELDIKQNPQRARNLLEKAETNMQDIKKKLREGANENEFEKLGILLHGYTALQKVLKKAVK